MQLPIDSLVGKCALVTGAASGLGTAIGRLLAACGAKVGLFDRDEEALQRVCAEIEKDGGAVIRLPGDVTSADDLAAAVESIKANWGCLYIVVANAGINGVWAPIDELTPEELYQTLDVNLKGTFQMVRASIPTLKAAGAGSVILISSLVGNRVFNMAGASAYAASKAGIVAFGKASALELAKDNIRVNVICPGAFKTNIQGRTICRNRENLTPRVTYPEGTVPLNTDERRNPEKVAQLVWFLASDMANYITGTEVYIDGANLSSWAEVK